LIYIISNEVIYYFEIGEISLGITGSSVVPLLNGNDMLFYDLNDELRAYKRHQGCNK